MKHLRIFQLATFFTAVTNNNWQANSIFRKSNGIS